MSLAPSSRKMSSVSRMVSSYQRDRNIKMLDGQLRQDSSENSKQVNNLVVSQFLSNEQSSLQTREESAEKTLLTNLQSQKYG